MLPSLRSFARALDALSVLSFDFGAILGGFCIVDMNFYQVHFLLH
jgi:hypothetical protein